MLIPVSERNVILRTLFKLAKFKLSLLRLEF